MSMNITIPLLLVGGLLLLPLLLDVLSLFGLAWEIPSASRAIYHKVRGHVVVQTPKDLRIALANGLIRPGDHLVAGRFHEGEGGLITRFAIHPSVVGRPAGVMLRVLSISPERLVLEEPRHSPSA